MCRKCHKELTRYNCNEGDFDDNDAEYCFDCEEIEYARKQLGGLSEWCTDKEFEEYEKRCNR